jgi:hypothetical protein
LNYRELDVPCFECKGRYVGCHGKCDRYASFVKLNEERRNHVFQEKENNLALIDNVRKWARRSGKYLKNVYY